MVIIAWNCQGAASKKLLRAVCFLVKTHNPKVLALFETKTSGVNADKVCKELKFNNWIRVEAIGFSGGIWLLWNDDLDLQIIYTHPQCIVMEIKETDNVWNVAFVYASPDYQLRDKLWKDLRGMKLKLHEAWMAVGDFNVVTGVEEVSNSKSFSQ